MSKFKVTIDFSGYTAPDLGSKAQTIHDSMVKNVAIFATPTPTMAALATLISTYDTALAARASRSIADHVAFDIARHELEVALGELGGYVNGIAQGDEAICVASGFPYYDATRRPPDLAPPPAPTGLVLRQGTLSGSYVARYHAARSPSMNEMQQCIGDPGVEANWHHVGMFSGGKAFGSGVVPGTPIWVRVRTAGLKGVMGEWSDPARMIVV